MPGPLVKTPNLNKGEIFNLSGEVADTAAGDFDSLRYELSTRNDLFPNLLDASQKNDLGEYETSLLARDSNFDVILSLRNEFAGIRLTQDKLSATVDFDSLHLTYDDDSRVFGVNFRNQEIASKGRIGAIDKIDVNLNYNFDSDRLTSGRIKLFENNRDAEFFISDDRRRIALGFKDPENDFRLSVKYEQSLKGNDWFSIQIEEPGKSLAFSLSPDGNLYELRGNFKLKNDIEFSSASFFSESEIKQRCSIIYLRPAVSASFSLECQEHQEKGSGFSGMLNLEIRDFNLLKK